MDVRRTKVQFDLGQVVFPFYRCVALVNTGYACAPLWVALGIRLSQALMSTKPKKENTCPSKGVKITEETRLLTPKCSFGACVVLYCCVVAARRTSKACATRSETPTRSSTSSASTTRPSTCASHARKTAPSTGSTAASRTWVLGHSYLYCRHHRFRTPPRIGSERDHNLGALLLSGGTAARACPLDCIYKHERRHACRNGCRFVYDDVLLRPESKSKTVSCNSVLYPCRAHRSPLTCQVSLSCLAISPPLHVTFVFRFVVSFCFPSHIISSHPVPYRLKR